MSSRLNCCIILLIAAVAQFPLCSSFVSPTTHRKRPQQQLFAASSSSNNVDECTISSQQRRAILSRSLIVTAGTILSTSVVDNKIAHAAADGQLTVLLNQIKEGSKQLEAVPDLIKAEQWDAGM